MSALLWFFYLPVGKQRAVKRAVAILTRAGISAESALNMLHEAAQELPNIHRVSSR